MKNSTSIARNILIVTIMLILNSISVNAQINMRINEKTRLDVVLMQEKNDHNETGNKILESVKSAVKKNGVLDSENPECVLLMTTNDDLPEMTIASVSLIVTLPKEMVEMAAKENLFYHVTGQSKNLENTESAKKIRYDVTKEWLSNFGSPLTTKIFIVKSGEIEKMTNQIVSLLRSEPKKM